MKTALRFAGFAVLGAMVAIVVAILGATLLGWSNPGIVGFYGLSVACATISWVVWRLSYQTMKTIQMGMEKRRVENLPEFMGGKCPPHQFEWLTRQIRLCWYARNGDGVYVILTS